MPTARSAVLTLACAAMLGATTLAGTPEAQAQVVTTKSLKVTVRGGSRTGPMSIQPVQCDSYNNIFWCQVTVTNPAGPLVNVDQRRGPEMGMLGCNFLTHSVADARAIYAQLTDPSTSALVSCGDTSATAAAPPAAVVLQFDLTALRATQSIVF
jgi:hypothetical protein